MNTANLQLEGLYLAIASINDLLVAKGMVKADELDLALRRAEANATAEERMEEEMSPANRDAICFPIRAPLPVTIWAAAPGTPASKRSCVRKMLHIGVSLDGLMMTALPITRAGATLCA